MAASDRLRAAGFVRLPPLWVRGEDMPAIHAMAHRHAETVNAIRHEDDADPRSDMDAAWAAFERERG